MTRRNASDRERKGQRNVHSITVCAETDFATSETLEGSERRIVSGLPRIINLQRSLPLIHVTSALNAMTPVFFVATVAAVSADQAIQAGSDCGHGVFGFAEDPYL